MNPIVDQLNRMNMASGGMVPYEQALAMIRGAADPIGMLNQLAMSDQRISKLSDVIQQNGNARNAFFAEAKRRGRDPNKILEQAKSLLK